MNDPGSGGRVDKYLIGHLQSSRDTVGMFTKTFPDIALVTECPPLFLSLHLGFLL
jgi:hypothetical protein